MPRSNARVDFSAFFFVVVILGMAPFAFSQADWSVTNTFHIGGEGGWDYVTVDPETNRLYVTRTTHTMVINCETGKVIGDILGQKRAHGVALVPSVGRGFITDGGAGTIVVFDLKTNAVLPQQSCGQCRARDSRDGTGKCYANSDGLVGSATGSLVKTWIV